MDDETKAMLEAISVIAKLLASSAMVYELRLRFQRNLAASAPAKARPKRRPPKRDLK